MEFTGTGSPCDLARVEEEGLPATGTSQSLEAELLGFGFRDQVGGGSSSGVQATAEAEAWHSLRCEGTLTRSQGPTWMQVHSQSEHCLGQAGHAGEVMSVPSGRHPDRDCRLSSPDL